MTREEVRKKYKLQFERDISIALKVVRDFNKRSCDNCKYYKEDKFADWYKFEYKCYKLDMRPSSDFSCNKWEKNEI